MLEGEDEVKAMKKAIMAASVLGLAGVVAFIGEGVPADEPTFAKEIPKLEEIEAEEYFSGHDGTFVLHDLQQDRTFVYNHERAEKAFPPQSTFTVANALIGLETGAVEDEYDIKYWDGIERELDVWNKDHTLGSGLRHSVVWYYQALASDIGEEQMQKWLDAISYGNRDITGGIDQFWLSSSLEITPLEQADFIHNLYYEVLPFSKDAMKTVKRMMMEEEGDHFTLYGKTGQGPDVGWYVGFIESGNGTYAFVTNLDGTSAHAKEITLSLLEEFHLMDGPS